MKMETLALALAVVLTFSMTACTSDSGSTDKASSGSETVEKSVSEEEEIETEAEEVEEETETEEIEAEDTEEENNETLICSLEPFTLEAECCSITFNELVKDNSANAYKIKVTLENNSEDAPCMFVVDDGYVNGLGSFPDLSARVGKGRKSDQDIIMSYSDLDKIIEDLTQLDLHVKIGEYDVYDQKPFYDNLITIYPYGEDKATVYERKAEESDQILMENDLLSVTYISFKQSPVYEKDYFLDLYFENKSDKDLSIYFSDILVNENNMSTPAPLVIRAGKNIHNRTVVFVDSTEDDAIEEVKELQMTLSIIDGDDWLWGEELLCETYSLKP